MERRYFLMGAAAAATAGARVFTSANDTVRIAIVGCGGRGGSHLREWTTLPNVELVAISDIDQSHMAGFVKRVESSGKKAPQGFQDMRKILDDKSIDAISIATPNHWHALQTIWACQAGKDVYVEKPCTYNIFEARQIVAAARKYDRMVQQGSQSRSSEALQEGVQKMREGLIGDVYMARGLCYKTRNTIGHTPVSEVPEGVDYDLWTGPAPKRPFTKNRFHYNWHWFWDTGNGDIGNQGIHEMDKARWGLGVKYPIKVSAIGGHFMFDDDQETPNVLNASFEFNENGKTKMLEFEVRHWITNREYMVPSTGGGAGAGRGAGAGAGAAAPEPAALKPVAALYPVAVLAAPQAALEAAWAAAAPSATCTTAPTATWSSTTTTSTSALSAESRRPVRRRPRTILTSRTSWTACALTRKKCSTAKSRKARPPRFWCTWPTSLIGWAAPSISIPRH